MTPFRLTLYLEKSKTITWRFHTEYFCYKAFTKYVKLSGLSSLTDIQSLELTFPNGSSASWLVNFVGQVNEETCKRQIALKLKRMFRSFDIEYK